MPRFSKQERDRLHELLIIEGEKLFNENGLDFVTAEDIAHTVGIAKGTFYNFYQNKEHLYMVINNRIQDEIFQEFKNQFQRDSNLSQSKQLYQVMCYVMEKFLEHPLIMEVRPEIWKRIEEKAPKECIEENNNRDLDLFTYLKNQGFCFRYDLTTIMQIIQLQFTQLAYIKNKTHTIELLKIVMIALSEHLLLEDTNENTTN